MRQYAAAFCVITVTGVIHAFYFCGINWESLFSEIYQKTPSEYQRVNSLLDLELDKLTWDDFKEMTENEEFNNEELKIVYDFLKNKDALIEETDFQDSEAAHEGEIIIERDYTTDKNINENPTIDSIDSAQVVIESPLQNIKPTAVDKGQDITLENNIESNFQSTDIGNEDTTEKENIIKDGKPEIESFNQRPPETEENMYDKTLELMLEKLVDQMNNVRELEKDIHEKQQQILSNNDAVVQSKMQNIPLDIDDNDDEDDDEATVEYETDDTDAYEETRDSQNISIDTEDITKRDKTSVNTEADYNVPRNSHENRETEEHFAEDIVNTLIKDNILDEGNYVQDDNVHSNEENIDLQDNNVGSGKVDVNIKLGEEKLADSINNNDAESNIYDDGNESSNYIEDNIDRENTDETNIVYDNDNQNTEGNRNNVVVDELIDKILVEKEKFTDDNDENESFGDEIEVDDLLNIYNENYDEEGDDEYEEEESDYLD